MTRDEFVSKVRRFAEWMARGHGCGEMHVGEDRQKGIWGEEMTRYLEERFGGDCSTEIEWTGGDADDEGRPERRVKFRFRFSSPCVSVSLDHRRTFAELEFSDYDYESKQFCGDYELHELHSWGGRGGIGLLDAMVSAWEAFGAEPAVLETDFGPTMFECSICGDVHRIDEMRPTRVTVHGEELVVQACRKCSLTWRARLEEGL